MDIRGFLNWESNCLHRSAIIKESVHCFSETFFQFSSYRLVSISLGVVCCVCGVVIVGVVTFYFIFQSKWEREERACGEFSVPRGQDQGCSPTPPGALLRDLTPGVHHLGHRDPTPTLSMLSWNGSLGKCQPPPSISYFSDGKKLKEARFSVRVH